MEQIEKTPAWIAELDENLDSIISDDSSILCLSDAYYFGGWTERKIYANPASITPQTIEIALNDYMDVDYVLIKRDSDGEVLKYLSERYKSYAEVCDYYLFDCK